MRRYRKSPPDLVELSAEQLAGLKKQAMDRRYASLPKKTGPGTFHDLKHRQRREGDEIACSCGARWPTDEEHP